MRVIHKCYDKDWPYIRGCEDKVVLVISLYLEHKRVDDFLIFTAMHPQAQEYQLLEETMKNSPTGLKGILAPSHHLYEDFLLPEL